MYNPCIHKDVRYVLDYVTTARCGDWYAQMPLAAGVGWRRSVSRRCSFNLHTRFVLLPVSPHHFNPMTMRSDPQDSVCMSILEALALN